MWHRGSPKQRIWMGPGRHTCGCDRRIPFANTYSYCYCYSHSDCDGHSDGNGNGNLKPFSNRNRYSDANR